MSIGLTDADLEDGGDGNGVGSTFKVWRSKVPIYGQIVAYLPTAQAWGPQITLNPAIIDEQSILFGREDFFGAFGVSFEQVQTQRIFHLDY